MRRWIWKKTEFVEGTNVGNNGENCRGSLDVEMGDKTKMEATRELVGEGEEIVKET